MADIRKFSVEQTGRIVLRDAGDEIMLNDGKEIAVSVYGPGSKQYAKAQAAQQNRIIDKLKRKGKTEQTAEQKAVEASEFLSDCTQSWENMEYDDLTGDALSKAVYSDRTIGFIADQVAKFIGDWSSFTKVSTTT